jgi:hypothetical protein
VANTIWTFLSSHRKLIAEKVACSYPTWCVCYGRFSPTFRNLSVILCWSVLFLVEKTGVPRRNRFLQLAGTFTIYSCIEYSWIRAEIQLSIKTLIGTNCIASCKSNYNDISHTEPSLLDIYSVFFLYFIYLRTNFFNDD